MTDIDTTELLAHGEPGDCACDHAEKPGLSRRALFGAAAAGGIGALAASVASPRYAFAEAGATGDILISIFLKGGMDALSAVVPYTERAYIEARPSLKVQGSNIVDLDGQFGLHLKLKPLASLYQSGQMAIVHAVGSPDPSRSHFDAIAALERGIPYDKSTTSGWIGRHLATRTGSATFRALSINEYVQVRTSGGPEVLATPSIDNFGYFVRKGDKAQVSTALKSLYAGAVHPLASAGSTAADAVSVLASVAANPYTVENGATYTAGTFGKKLMQVSKVIKADVGMEAAAIDFDGWDFHINLGTPTSGKMATLLNELGLNLAALATDLGSRMDRVTIVVMSEFGRRLYENDGGGLDHGRGGAMFIVGNGINGGRVYGQWPTLEVNALDRGDLAVTTDYRDVLSEIVDKRLVNAASLDTIFPGYTPSYLGLAKPRL